MTTGFGSSTTAAEAPTWRWGWVAGLGAETRIAHSDWLGRIEYLHYDFGTTAESITVTDGTATTLDEGRLTADVIRAGLSYQLN